MICPRCQLDAVGVGRTIDNGSFVLRRRSCYGCKAAWSTAERLIRGTLVAGGKEGHGPPGKKKGVNGQTLVTTGGQPAKLREVLDSDPASSSLDQLPDPPSLPDLEASDSGARAIPGGQRRKRGKKKPTSEHFEACWKLYGRGEDKEEAFLAWKAVAMEFGGEVELRALISAALSWQAPNWEKEGWKFAPYFCRYLSHRRWEDKPLPAPVMPRMAAQTSIVGHGWLEKHGGAR